MPNLGSKVSRYAPSPHRHHSAKPADDLTERADANDAPEYPAQDEGGDENPTSEEFGQATTQQQADDAGSGAHTVDRFSEGESSNGAEPERAQPDNEETAPDLLPSDEHTEQPVGVVEGDHEQETETVTVSEGGHPGSTADLDTAAIHEHFDVRNTPPLGGNSTEYEEVVATNEDFEAHYNEGDPDSEPGETVTIQGDAIDGDWETTSNAQQTQDDLEQHEVRGDSVGVDKRAVVRRVVVANELTPPSTDSDTIDLTDPRLDDGPIAAQQGE